MPLSDQNSAPLSSSPIPTLGKYKILRVIARSNDVVYEALDPGMNRRLAVKELALSPNLSGQQRRERIERFYREAKAAGNLSHPNIVTVHEVGQEGDRHYIAMEYLEGPSLRDILRMRATLSIRESLSVALQLTDALGYAHAQGVVHRDVKPDNIHLVLPNDAVKLTDFGIARILSDPAITSTGQVFGTPSYMSPEQIMSKEVDHRTDIFSLGVVLYEMIVGKKPFSGDSVITITYHIMNTAPSIPGNLPPGVFSVISRALTKDPNHRYQNMAAMAADLHAEIAFSDSPYHRTIPPGVLTAKQLSEEQTALIDRGDLPKPSPAPAAPPTSPGYAPATGISDAIAGGPVAAATSVTPVNLPHAPTQQESTKSAVTLVASVVGVMVVVIVLVFVVAKAYETSRIDAQTRAAEADYSRANAEVMTGNRDAALADYKLALRLAPEGSQVSVWSRSAVTQLTDLENGITLTPQPAPAAPDHSAQPSTAPTEQAPPADNTGTAIPSGKATAQADCAEGDADEQKGDEEDAITAYIAANTADPTGDDGKKAGSSLAKIYSARGDTALRGGQTQSALDDWQLVVKYAPADPLADMARQKILQYGTSGSTPSTSSSTTGSSTDQTSSSNGP